MARILSLPLVLAAAPATISAQSLTASPFVQGQIVQVDASGFGAGELIVLLASPNGAGVGPCLDTNACLGLADPILVVASAAADPGGAASFALPLSPTIPLIPVALQTLGVSIVGGALDFQASNAVAGTIEPIAALGDDFEGSSLDPKWTVWNASDVDVGVGGGELLFVPHAFTLWYQGSEGPAILQRVTGDFTVTASVSVSAPGGGPPATQYRLGGLIARDPANLPGVPLDWVHVAAGSGDLAHPIAVEHKVTQDSTSSFAFVDVADLDVELRIRRTGATFVLSFREDSGSPWTVAQTYVHPGMPATLDVGLMAYADSPTPGIELRCAELTFAP